MADNKKIYTIEINGISQSIKQVDALKEALNGLDTKIKAMEASTINVSSKTNVSTPNGLSEEVALQRELNRLKDEGVKLDAKIEASQTEVYKKVEATKDLYKEAIADQKALAAQERLTANEYSNTMQGMKQNLADLKAVISTTDLGDSDQIKKMTENANELTNKLKKMEEAYGQFGRNVGNYASAAEGFKNIQITVGGVVREFESAREASKTLGNELKTMAINGEQGTKKFKELQKAVAMLNSDIKDATVSSKAMDELLDTMQSFAALGSVTQGFSALFGFDDKEIQQSIQKLVALQNVMQGIEKLNQQINSQEGIGGWIAKGNQAIDSFVEKLVGANKAQQTLNATTQAGATAAKSMAAAETAQAAATTTATVATKALSLALKTIGIGLIISAVATLITYWKDIYKWFTDTIPALKNLSKWFDKIRAVAVGVGTAIVNYMIQPLVTFGKIVNDIIHGNFSDIGKHLVEGFKKTFNVVENYQKGYHKEIERQQEVHNEKMRQEQMKANEEAEKDAEAKYGRDYKRTQEYYKKQLALVKKGSEEERELKRKLWQSEREEQEANDKKRKAAQGKERKEAKEIAQAEQELSRLRIENMKEGLNKQLAQLEEERKQKILKIRADGIMVGELELEINKLYDRKIEEEKERHAEEVKRVYEKMWNDIYNISLENYRKEKELAENSSKQYEAKLEQGKNKLYNQGISSYGVQGKKQLSQSTRDSLGIVSQNTDEYVKDYKKLIDIMREYSTAENAYKTLTVKRNAEIEEAQKRLVEVEKETNEKLKQLEWDRAFMNDDEAEQKKYEIEKVLDVERLKIQKLRETSEQEVAIVLDTLNAKKALYDEYNAELNQKYDTEEKQAKANATFNLLIEENYTKDMSTMFKQRMTVVEAYWATRIANEKVSAEALYEQTKEVEDKEYQARRRNAISQAESLNSEAFNQVKAGKLTQKEYEEYVERLQTETQNKLILLEKEYSQKMVDLENEKNEKLKRSNTEYFQDTLQEFRDFNTALSQLEQKQPVMNAWGLKNIKETNKNNKELLSSYDELARQLSEKRQKITDAFQNGIIDEAIYKQSIRELDSFSANLGEKMDEVKGKLSFSGQWKDWAENINDVLQQVGQTVNSVLSSLSEITDNHYEKEIDKQQEYIDKYEEQLNKQRDITQQYADEVDNIESELSNARGDRREHLIDQLNAEMAAQRASLAQEKKIEKERQKALDKQKKLEHDQAVAKKKMQLAQAAINTAMAISMAAVNSWPIPAIPMMALAAAAGAAQIAAISSQNIPSYGSGGVIEGKSHSQGGVKVLGGRAEVEGGEFITNKVTTSKNVDLLEYINGKRKKINLEDLIEFYGTPVRKNIQTVRTKFADGGIVPTLRNDINISDRMLTAFEDYSNRPVQVAVVDIIDRTQQVNDVKVMAGIDA